MTETNILQGVWPEWQIVREIGRGSYGVVYEAVRNEYRFQSHAAIKVISVPQNHSEVESLRAEGLTIEDTKKYLQGVVDDFIGEIRLMDSLKGVTNIVSVEDYHVVENSNDIGWQIFIRMNLLTPLNAYLQNNRITSERVIRLGRDLCSALERCEKANIIHRDIKPENIFLNSDGDFVLGDFGIARKLEGTVLSLSSKGTPYYMAPEIEKGDQYDNTVDIYSLGLVLYRFANRGCLPFQDPSHQPLSASERKESIRRRLAGEILPPPCDASPELAAVILKACAFDPHQRYASATDMKHALLATCDELDRTISVRKPQAHNIGQQPISNPYNQQIPNIQQTPYNQQTPNVQQNPYNQQMPNVQQNPYNQQMPNVQQDPYNQQMPNVQQDPYNRQMPNVQQNPFNQQSQNTPDNDFFHPVSTDNWGFDTGASDAANAWGFNRSGTSGSWQDTSSSWNNGTPWTENPEPPHVGTFADEDDNSDRKKLIIIIGAAVLALIIAGGILLSVMLGGSNNNNSTDSSPDSSGSSIISTDAKS